MTKILEPQSTQDLDKYCRGVPSEIMNPIKTWLLTIL